MKYTAESISDLPAIAKELLKHAGSHRIFAFYGAMGAGKTTFILSLIKLLGVAGKGSSPTFSIVNEYAGSGDLSIYHFDFYRIEDIEEAYDLGYEEYFFSGSYCLIEWPERIEELSPAETVKITIESIGALRRIKLDLPL